MNSTKWKSLLETPTLLIVDASNKPHKRTVSETKLILCFDRPLAILM